MSNETEYTAIYSAGVYTVGRLHPGCKWEALSDHPDHPSALAEISRLYAHDAGLDDAASMRDEIERLMRENAELRELLREANHTVRDIYLRSMQSLREREGS